MNTTPNAPSVAQSNRVADRCPLDNGSMMPDEAVDRYYVCISCHELLGAEELVSQATRATQQAYLQRNYPDGVEMPADYLELADPQPKVAPTGWLTRLRGAITGR